LTDSRLIGQIGVKGHIIGYQCDRENMRGEERREEKREKKRVGCGAG
jgi:hypothetical protein